MPSARHSSADKELRAEDELARRAGRQLRAHEHQRRLRIWHRDADLGESVATDGGSDPDVGAEREHEPTGDRMARDRRDDRAWQGVGVDRHPVDPLHHRALVRRPVPGDRLEVNAAGEES